MGIATSRTNLAAAITNTGLRAHAVWPDQITVPCAIVGPPTGTYGVNFDGDMTLSFPVFLFIAPVQVGVARGQEAVDPYLEPTGTKSVMLAIQNVPSLHAVATGFDRYDALKDINGIEYWGAVVTVLMPCT